MIETTHEQRKALREQDWYLNVRDEFRGMTKGEIQNALRPRRNGLMFAFVNAIRDFNFSALIRASNAFCCQGVVYTGFRKFDPRGAVGTLNYEYVQHLPDEQQFIDWIERAQRIGYEFVVAESDEYDKSVLLPNFYWRSNTILMLGEESVGVEQKYIDMADRVVSIPQIGSVRSLNVASAGHILAYDFMVKTGGFK
jgi:tRNA G18 (ribose-2'-O)-methylase SpoU